MKRLLYLCLMISICLFNVNVFAENVYKEGSWTEVSGDTCDKYTEVASAYTAYTFDSATGKFSTSGSVYSIDGPMSMVYYTVSSDQKTLYAYVPSYDSNKSLIPSSVGISTGKSCADTYKVSKTSEVLTEDDSSTENNPNTDNTGSTNINDNENNENNENSNEENVAHEDNPTEYFPGTADGSLTGNQDLQTTDNPSTGIEDYIIYLVAFSIVGGTVLIFKKKKMFNM